MRGNATALRDSEARYRSILDSIDEAYAIADVPRDEHGGWSTEAGRSPWMAASRSSAYTADVVDERSEWWRHEAAAAVIEKGARERLPPVRQDGFQRAAREVRL